MTLWASALETLDQFYASTLPLGCPLCGGIDSCHYGCANWDESELVAFERENDGYPVTWNDSHAEWHRNAGVPMGTPGCPWDACDGPARWELEEEAVAVA